MFLAFCLMTLTNLSGEQPDAPAPPGTGHIFYDPDSADDMDDEDPDEDLDI